MPKTIVILGEGNYLEHQHSYIQATGEFGKENNFQFVSIEGGQYCDGLKKIETIINKNDYVDVYVFLDYYTSKNFKRRLVRNLNRRKPKLRNILETTNAFFVDLRKGKTEPFLKKDMRDKKTITKRRVAA